MSLNQNDLSWANGCFVLPFQGSSEVAVNALYSFSTVVCFLHRFKKFKLLETF